MLLHEAIRAKRLAAGYSLKEFAQLSTLHYSYLSRIETGLINPSLETLQLIAMVYEQSAQDLLNGSQYAAPINGRQAIYQNRLMEKTHE